MSAPDDSDLLAGWTQTWWQAIDDFTTLLLYTDGLVERRGEHLDEGLERLREAGSRHAHLPVEKFLDAVLRDLVDADLDDDIAVMAVRFTPTG